jgi:gamma-glutamyltranspeptidase/glutathione hydrolase
MGTSRFDHRSSVFASGGMVAASSPLATQAGLRVLADGGNAVDAALATAAVVGVVEPMMNGLGGDMWAMVWWEDEQRVYGLNASGRCPDGLTAGRFAGCQTMPQAGWETVTVPGACDGYSVLHERFATRPLSELVAPAVGFARDGFPVGESIAHVWAYGAGKLEQFGTAGYLMDGRPPVPGQRFRHPELADTWELFGREGREGFYTGPVAHEIARACAAGGGAVTEADLASQRAEWVEPIGLGYRGRQILEMPPNGQGIIALVALGILALEDLGSLSPADRMHLEIEATRIGFEEADLLVGDPRCVEVDVDAVLTDAALSRLHEQIDRRRARTRPVATSPHGDTTYLCVADAAGNAVSLITSISDVFGAGVVAGNTGVLMHTRGAAFSLDPQSPNLIAPGRRPRHSILPAMAMRDGRPEIVFGCMGGNMQPQGHIQLLVNVLDLDMGLQAAIDAPRYRILEGDEIAFEETLDPELVDDLGRRGHQRVSGDPPPSDWTSPHAFVRSFKGSAQMIRFHRDHGSLEGAADPRLDGVAIGL